MTIPDSKTIVNPLLNYLKDGKEHSMKEVEEYLASHFKLNENEKNQPKPSGHETLFHNRIHWAKFYLKKDGLINDPKRSFTRITSEGLQTLRQRSQK